MRDFLLKKDLWSLDLVSSVLFGLGLAYLQSAVGRIIHEVTWDRILFAMFMALAAYLATFTLALLLRKNLKFLRSWMWMGIVGTLIYLGIGRLIYLYPRNLNTYDLNSDTTFMAIMKVVSGEVVSVIGAGIFLIPLACACIFAMRFIAYFIAGRNQVDELE